MLNIYHNPRCSKSRQTLALLVDSGHSPIIIDYQKAPLSQAQIKALRDKLGLADVRAMMRKGEDAYKDNGLKDVTDQDALIAAIAAHPKLLERPVVETQSQAKIGRPPEAVLELFK